MLELKMPGKKITKNEHMYTNLLLLISMLWHRQAIFESKGDKLSSSAESRIRTQRVSDTFSPADWMTADKPTELSRIKLKTWTRQPVPMISKHSADLTPLPFGIRTWLWRYTYLLQHILETSLYIKSTALSDLNFGQLLTAGCLTRVTPISGLDLLLWLKPYTKNIKWFCKDVMATDVNQFGNINLLITIIETNHICFCIFIYGIILTAMSKLCVPHEEWSNLGMTDSSVLASTLILSGGTG